MINPEVSKLMAEIFNRLDHKQKASIPEDKAKRIGDFMVENGYRFAFDRWYLQEDPAQQG